MLGGLISYTQVDRLPRRNQSCTSSFVTKRLEGTIGNLFDYPSDLILYAKKQTFTSVTCQFQGQQPQCETFDEIVNMQYLGK